MKGQEILLEDFKKSTFAMEVIEGMTAKEELPMYKEKISKVEELPMSSGMTL